MIGDEFKSIVMSGEFSEELELLIGTDGNTVFIFDEKPMLFNGTKMGVFNEFTIHGIVKQGWKRSEVDGVLTTEFPREAVTFTISKDSLPDITIKDNKAANVLFLYKNIMWEVIYVIGNDLLSFMVTPKDDLTTDDTLDTEDEELIESEYEDVPGLV